MLLTRYTGSGQWERALETARQWLSEDPENIRAHLTAGQSLINLDREPEAHPHITKVLQNQPENAFAHRLMSMIYFHLEQFKAADDEIQQAISLQPEVHYNWYHLAHMCYKQRDFKSARKFAEKSRELNPLDASTLNLLGLCADEEGGSLDSEKQLDLYLQALELNPENSLILNNIGVYHLNETRDYKVAENYYRQGLYFDPSSKLIRKNLFITIKHRDLVYKILTYPRDLIARFAAMRSRLQQKSVFLWILLIPVWIISARFLIFGLVIWFTFFWPLLKVYEHLTIGDILSKAGEIGSKTGGIFGYRAWPFRLRITLFFFVLLLFWGGVLVLGQSETGSLIIASLLGLSVLGYLATRVPQWIKRGKAGSHASRRAKKMKNLIQPKKTKHQSSKDHSNPHE